MGCTSTKLKSKKDLNFKNIPIQMGRNMSKEEGINSREQKIWSPINLSQKLKKEDQISPQQMKNNQSNTSNIKVSTSQ